MPGPYCLDTNIFIQAKNGPYAMDIVPGFWDWLDKEAEAGNIISCRTVHEEMNGAGDDLAAWVKARRDTPFFQPPDAQTQATISAIGTYVVGAYVDYQASEFMNGADPWIIARAQVHKLTVVTHERLVANPTPKTRVKIPNVCQKFDVQYIGPYDMLRALGAKFNM